MQVHNLLHSGMAACPDPVNPGPACCPGLSARQAASELALKIVSPQYLLIYLATANSIPINMYFFIGRRYPTAHWESCHFKTLFFFFFILLSWWFSNVAHFFFFKNLPHKNLFISVNLLNRKASPLQLINNASINHNHAEYRQRLILSNFVYKVCSKTHLSLEVYLHIQNIQFLNSSEVLHWLIFNKRCLKAASYFSVLILYWKQQGIKAQSY